jgi:NitT/TauT family transport system substrate-binding protein
VGRDKMKKLISITISLILLLSVAGCSNSQKTSEPAALKTITIGVMPDTDSIPFVIADKEGYFKAEGVNVKIQHFTSARDRDSALQSGKIDGAISDVLAAAFISESGFKIKIVAATTGNYKLVASKNSNIKKISDIKGKNVAISTNTLIEYSTDKFLESASLKPSDVHKIAIPQIPTRLEMLQNGKVDAAVLPEPMASLAILNGGSLVSSTEILGINPGVLMFTSSSINANQNEIKEILSAYNKAVKYLNEEPKSQYMDMVIKECSFPTNVKDSIVLPKYKNAYLPNEKDVTSVLSWLKEKNLIKNEYKYSDLVTSEFVR